jgi:hypothetical protein
MNHKKSRFALDKREVLACYLRGKYVHSHKGRTKRRHKLAPRTVVREFFVGEIHFATAVISPMSFREQIMGGHVSQIPVSKE